MDLYNVYRRMGEKGLDIPPPVTLDAIWEAISGSRYLQNAGGTVSSNNGRQYLKLRGMDGTPHGSAVTVDCMRNVIEIGSDEELVLKARDSIRFLEEAVKKNSNITLDKYLEAQKLFDATFLQMEKGQWLRAIAGFQKCSEINPGHAQNFGNMGICYAQLGEKSKALAAFDKALEIDPEYEPAIVNRIHVEKLEDGKPLTTEKIKSIEYYREYPHKNKSYLQSLLNETVK